MSLNPHPKYPGVWVARVYSAGRKKDPATGKASNKRKTILFEGDEAAALSWYAGLLRGNVSKAAPPLAPTLQEAWADFCGYYENSAQPSTYRDYLCTWEKHLKPYFGPFRPGQLTSAMIENYKRFRVKQPTTRGPTTKPKTINKELSYLSSMCTWMALPENNKSLPLPFIIKGFPASKTEPPTPQVLTHPTMIRFIRAAEREKFRPIFAVYYYTGMRKTEVLNLRSDQINLDLNTINVTVKGGKIKTFPIHRKIRVYLRNRKRAGVRYLFTNPKTLKPWVDLDCAISRAAKKAKISQHLHLHLFRHSFGVQSILSGIELRTTQQLMGHASSQTTERYTKLAAQHLVNEIDKFGGGSAKKTKITQQLLQEIIGALNLNNMSQPAGK